MSDVSSCLASIAIQLETISQDARKGLDEHVNRVFLISTETYCPVDKGNLKGSANNEIVENSVTTYTRRISYGGEGVDYAYWVHEIPKNHFNPPAACWKYLERAVNETSTDLVNTISSFIRT